LSFDVRRFDVRRLAAVDMYGGKGSPTRAKIIKWEFIVGAVFCLGLGLLSLAWHASATGIILGAWLVGAGLNYIPLALHAISLSRPGALAAELDGVDVMLELRFYGLAQLWLAVPLAIVLFALRGRRTGVAA
jgi:hypothetical protein